MAGTVYEWFGYRPDDRSEEAVAHARSRTCPFVGGGCTKVSPNKPTSGGGCSILPSGSQVPVIVCPSRLYAHDHAFLGDIALDAFAKFEPLLSEHDRPVLVRGSVAALEAQISGRVQIGVFGKGWDKEIQLPPSTDGGAAYSVDFTLIAVSPEGELLGFVPVEVQTIDTTGSYMPTLTSLCSDRGKNIQSTVGLNWENVSKRILPQLIVKGLMLQGERLCTMGIYFVTPNPVFEKIARRLGGMERLREIPKQPGSITFVRYEHSPEWSGSGPLETKAAELTTISTSDMSLAFISPQNLPKAGAYEVKLRSESGVWA